MQLQEDASHLELRERKRERDELELVSLTRGQYQMLASYYIFVLWAVESELDERGEYYYG